MLDSPAVAQVKLQYYGICFRYDVVGQENSFIFQAQGRITKRDPKWTVMTSKRSVRSMTILIRS